TCHFAVEDHILLRHQGFDICDCTVLQSRTAHHADSSCLPEWKGRLLAFSGFDNADVPLGKAWVALCYEVENDPSIEIRMGGMRLILLEEASDRRFRNPSPQFRGT